MGENIKVYIQNKIGIPKFIFCSQFTWAGFHILCFYVRYIKILSILQLKSELFIFLCFIDEFTILKCNRKVDVRIQEKSIQAETHKIYYFLDTYIILV